MKQSIKIGRVIKYDIIQLMMGDSPDGVMLEFCIRKTLINRIKYWLFSKFFPFRVRWLKCQKN